MGFFEYHFVKNRHQTPSYMHTKIPDSKYNLVTIEQYSEWI